ncbi:MAG TPA: 30S ribosomal protein S17 [Acidimicrobiia bacterium]
MAENATTRSGRKVRVGVVVSDSRDKTVTVEVASSSRHPRYDKIVRTSAKFHAHDETNDAHVGDTVRIMETRPLSKQKRWRVVEVVERAR